jgi:hypothetical protein
MAPKPSDTPSDSGKQTRRAAIAIASTMLGWMLLQEIGAQYDWPLRYALLVDLFALAGFIWALIFVFSIWRARRAESRTR